jgi:prolyl-tRNA editing enzyme YbaK/EbsC (Cys-tRNA(Pro) deacylase)
VSAVDRFLAAAGAEGDLEIRRMADSTRTAPEAAAAVGVEVRQIVKSLVFMADEAPVLALVAGDHRLDVEKLKAVLGAGEVRRASADEVRAATGFSIGGVPPFGHPAPLRTVLDEGLRRDPEVWAAAGTPYAVFGMAPDALAARAGAQVADVAEQG